MKNGGKAVATVAVWGGIVVLSYFFISIGIYWLVLVQRG